MAQTKSAQTNQTLDKQQRFQRLLAQGGREGALIGLVVLCIYLTMALVSYNPSDPGWASIGHQTAASNYAGRTGAWFASLFVSLFGYVSYLFPVLVGYSAILVFRRRNLNVQFHWPLFLLRLGGFLLLLLSATSLLTLYSLFGLDSTAGGLLGQEVSRAMVNVFNLPATTLILVAILLFAFTIFFGLSWLAVMDRVGATAIYCARKLAALGGMVARKGPEPESAAGTAAQSPTERTAEPAANKAKKRESREPPILHDRVEAPSREGRPRWWRRWLKMPGRRAKNPVKALERREPVLADSAAATTAPPPPAQKTPTPPPAPAKAEPGQKAPRITPLQSERKPAKKASKEAQPSLFDDLDRPIPPLSLLDPPEPHKKKGYSRELLEHMSRLLEEKLADFGVSVQVVEVNPGPVITRFEIQPAPGVKVSRISNLAKDLARSMAVISVRIVEVIPGKSVVGIEIPNEEREMVRLSEVLQSSAYEDANSALSLALGNDIAGNPVVANLSKMPHLLVAGTTGSGKSVGVNAMLLSMLLKATPDEVRFIMVDPKMLELSIYEGVPHLLAPVVTDMKEAANALRWCVAEMERRYRLMAALGVRNVAGYNRKVREARASGEPLLDPLWKPDEYLDNSEQARPELETLPFIVVVIDEFADMMMIVGKKVEELIARIAQKARAAGIHLILATQRPSVDVITGLIKANIPTRISFQVSSKVDSRTILDQGGAEQLLGHGDMLYMPPGTGLPMRVHGAFVDDEEVHRVVSAWKERGEPDYVEEVLNGAENESLPGIPSLGGGDGDSEQDSLYDDAVAFVTESRRVSISSVQRKFKIGYNRAANLVDAMEAAGVVSAAGHNGAREVLAPPPPRD